MTESYNGGMGWLFENGKADWIRWGVAMLIGAGVTWSAIQARVSVLEAQVRRIETSVDRLQDNTQSGLTAIQNTIIQLHNGR